MNLLISYGANERFFQEASLYPEYHLARVTAGYRGLYQIATEAGTGLAEVSGKFRHGADGNDAFPVVGDFVMVDRTEMDSGNAVIHHVLTRKSAFERIAAGSETQTQVLAANIAFIFVCMSLHSDYNLSRLERYLSVAWNSRATPVVVLTKADLCTDTDAKLAEISSAAPGVDVHVTSGLDAESCAVLLPYLKPGITATFVGSSGIGKSTLINCLAGEELLHTSHVRADGKGRHTTTHRELFRLPQGGIVIDTPGIRELGIESADLQRSFSEIDELGQRCRFHDCTHTAEPGCAVLQAVENGELEGRRLENYRKLKKEAAYEGLTAKQIESEKMKRMFSEFGSRKNVRNFIKGQRK